MSIVSVFAATSVLVAVVRLVGSARPAPSRLPAREVMEDAVGAHGAGPGVGTWVLSAIRSRREQIARRREIRDGLPDVVSLLGLAVGSGMNIRLALDVVGPRCPRVFADAFAEVNRRVHLGQPLTTALDAFDVLGEPLIPLTRGLVAAEHDGVPIGPTLERIAGEARAMRRRDAQEHAHRLPVRLLFPLVMCIMPALVVMTVVPVLGGALGSLSL